VWVVRKGRIRGAFGDDVRRCWSETRGTGTNPPLQGEGREHRQVYAACVNLSARERGGVNPVATNDHYGFCCTIAICRRADEYKRRSHDRRHPTPPARGGRPSP